MLLDHLGYRHAHDAILRAIETVLDPGSGAPRTPDIGGRHTTQDVGRAVAEAL
jgi:tartrate dehydrogenase/decarboxylase/D-malate dehydrogenase